MHLVQSCTVLYLIRIKINNPQIMWVTEVVVLVLEKTCRDTDNIGSWSQKKLTIKTIITVFLPVGWCSKHNTNILQQCGQFIKYSKHIVTKSEIKRNTAPFHDYSYCISIWADISSRIVTLTQPGLNVRCYVILKQFQLRWVGLSRVINSLACKTAKR